MAGKTEGGVANFCASELPLRFRRGGWSRLRVTYNFLWDQKTCNLFSRFCVCLRCPLKSAYRVVILKSCSRQVRSCFVLLFTLISTVILFSDAYNSLCLQKCFGGDFQTVDDHFIRLDVHVFELFTSASPTTGFVTRFFYISQHILLVQGLRDSAPLVTGFPDITPRSTASSKCMKVTESASTFPHSGYVINVTVD